MNAIVTAGGAIQPGEPLYETSGSGYKVMIDVAGKPMVQWVLDALGRSGYIHRIIVAGLPPETALDCTVPLVLLPDNGSMLDNIRAGAQEIQRIEPGATHAVLAAGDIPALRTEMVDWLCCQIDKPDQDFYLTVIERSTMEQQFPGIQRTYMRLKDGELCSGEMHCLRLQAAVEESKLWRRLKVSRKSRFRQATLLGYDTLLLLTLRQLNLRDAEETVSKRMGIQGRAVLSPYAELGVDVDKPHQLEIVREFLSRRHETDASGAD